MEEKRKLKLGRRPGPTDYHRRLKAFEMYASGVSKSDIARELGVTRPAITVWSTKDAWDERLLGIVSRAEEALNNVKGNEVAATLDRLRSKMGNRITELDALCQTSNAPNVRLQAIKTWLELAGIKRAMPNPTDPTTPKSLELIEDLLHTSNQTPDIHAVSDQILTQEFEKDKEDFKTSYEPNDPV